MTNVPAQLLVLCEEIFHVQCLNTLSSRTWHERRGPTTADIQSAKDTALVIS